MKNSISKPTPATLRIISAALDGDAGITPAHRRAIMEAIAKPPEAAVGSPEPAARFYTPTEAAAICGVTLAGLLGWVRSGRMEAQRMGARNYLIPASAVDAMLASRQPATTTLRADALPDRLAHLAVVAGTVKRPRKSKRG